MRHFTRLFFFTLAILFSISLTAQDTLPVQFAFMAGRYANDRLLDIIEENGQVIFRYCDEKGDVHVDVCPNGAVRNIAGIRNKAGNVFGMMPHPERVVSTGLGNMDGLKVFELLGLN